MTAGSDPTHRGGSGWFLAGYAGIAGFFALEAASREGGTAASLDTSADDQDTTKMIVTAFAAAVVLAPFVRRSSLLRLPAAMVPAGLVLEISGLALRAWSMETLGRAYTRTLRTEGDQPVIDTGPYRLVRHPGYLGSLLIWTGFGITSGSGPVMALVGGLLGRAYRRRIIAEEQLLRRDLPGYAAYSGRTKRLIPAIWCVVANATNQDRTRWSRTPTRPRA
jgi:protein-S-isoprenylcysteine O-methyltransferase Ste14